MNIRLFIKPGCPWCDEASDWLDARGIRYTTLDVNSDPAAWEEMRELTGQTRLPALRWTTMCWQTSVRMNWRRGGAR